MKFILILVIIAGSLKTCKPPSANQEEVVAVEYRAHTRGYSYKVEINQDQLIRFQNGSSDSLTLNSAQWRRVQQIAREIDLSQLSDLETETSGQALDRNAIVVLTIYTEDKDFESPQFDHGSPPKALKKLVDAVMELAQKLEAPE